MYPLYLVSNYVTIFGFSELKKLQKERKKEKTHLDVSIKTFGAAPTWKCIASTVKLHFMLKQVKVFKGLDTKHSFLKCNCILRLVLHFFVLSDVVRGFTVL